MLPCKVTLKPSASSVYIYNVYADRKGFLRAVISHSLADFRVTKVIFHSRCCIQMYLHVVLTKKIKYLLALIRIVELNEMLLAHRCKH